MKNFLNLGFVVLVLVVLGCNCSKLDEFTKSKDSTPLPTLGSTPAASETPTITTKASPSSAGPELTREKGDQIKNGMSRSAVEAILGEGEEVSTTKGGGLTFVVMKWADARYNYIIVSFRNDKVYSITKSIKK
jgi:hypothetical protein